MKVHGRGVGQPVPVDSAARPSAVAVPDQSSSTTKKNEGATRVKVSGAAQKLLDAQSPETPDLALVARIKDAIDKGAFKVDPERIADLMMEEER